MNHRIPHTEKIKEGKKKNRKSRTIKIYIYICEMRLIIERCVLLETLFSFNLTREHVERNAMHMLTRKIVRVF